MDSVCECKLCKTYERETNLSVRSKDYDKFLSDCKGFFGQDEDPSYQVIPYVAEVDYCITPCPHCVGSLGARVCSVSCQECKHHRGYTDEYVLCSFLSDKESK